MNITFLIGNGFDIRLGLKTKFTDFYDTYIKLNEYNDDWTIKKFCDNLKKDRIDGKMYEKWSDFEAAFPNYVESESEIINILNDFTQKFYSYLHEEVIDYCVVPDSKTTEKFEDFIFRGYKNAAIPSDANNIAGYFLDSTNNFNFINFNYTSSLSALINELFLAIKFTEGDVKRFSPKHLHIHGSVYESIIIGIDNVNELPSSCVQSPYISSYCVKSAMNSLLGNDNETLYKEIISRSDIVIAYGLSFGTSDKSRWKVLTNWLQANKTNHTLVVYQYEPDFSDKKIGSLKAYIPEYLRKINEIKVDFLINKLHVDSTIAQDPKFLKRIVLIDSDKVLNFKLTNDNEEQPT